METLKSPYKTLAEWRKASPKAYQAAYRRGMIDEICEKLGWLKGQRSSKQTLNAKLEIEDTTTSKKTKRAAIYIRSILINKSMINLKIMEAVDDGYVVEEEDIYIDQVPSSSVINGCCEFDNLMNKIRTGNNKFEIVYVDIMSRIHRSEEELAEIIKDTNEARVCVNLGGVMRSLNSDGSVNLEVLQMLNEDSNKIVSCHSGSRPPMDQQ